MKRLICIALLMGGMLSGFADSLTKVVLDGSNFDSKIVDENCLFIINEPIEIDRTYKVGDNSVIQFNGGRIIGGELNVNGAMVEAADYCIFDGTTVTGAFGNASVPALWFGHPDNDDIAPLVNRALGMAPSNVVGLGGGDYSIRTPIILDVQGQRFTHSGTLNLKADTAAVELRASDIGLELHRIAGTLNRGTGVRFSGNVYNGMVNVDEINDVDCGMDFAPDVRITGRDYAGVQYCKVSFNRIIADTGLRFNIYKNVPLNHTGQTESAKTVWINENQITGGVITARVGLECVDAKRDSIHGNVEMNCNVFPFLAFENVSETPMIIRDMEKCYFRSVYIEGESTHYINISNSVYTDITMLSELPEEKVVCGKSVFAGSITGPIRVTTGNGTRTMDKIMMNSVGYWNKGLTSKYLTTDYAPFNMVNASDFPGSNTKITNTLTIDDLRSKTTIYTDMSKPFENPFYFQTVMNGICVLNIGNNRQVLIDLENSSTDFVAPLTLVVRRTGNGEFGIPGADGRPLLYSIGDVFYVTLNSEWKWVLTSAN